jgi:hypothetical protein
MISNLPYAIIALLVIILIALLVRAPAADEPTAAEDDYGERFCIQDVGFLNLSHRLFDPSDYLWLRDELHYPRLAQTLARSRKRLALRWLRALKDSFKELVRTPEPNPSAGNAGLPFESGQLLWLTFRFNFLMLYALTVVRAFGPYHCLIPAPDWQRLIPVWTPPVQRVQDQGRQV